jgi:hypothetical protein
LFAGTIKHQDARNIAGSLPKSIYSLQIKAENKKEIFGSFLNEK